MYRLRLFATKHARGYETVYRASEPVILALLRGLSFATNRKADKLITWFEKHSKSLFFDCKMCGHCLLSVTGMTCPMNCPKTIRNGPCGGVRIDGHCEVKPEMKCVWVEAWNGAAKMKHGGQIQEVQFAPNAQEQGASAWLHMARDKSNKASYTSNETVL